MFAVREREAALDIVQDAMLRLAEKYGHRPAAELPLLFHRIVQNAIRDWYRRQKVRSLWTTLLSSLSPDRGEDADHDPLETLQEAGDSNREEGPSEKLERSQVLEIIEQEIAKLPARQPGSQCPPESRQYRRRSRRFPIRRRDRQDHQRKLA